MNPGIARENIPALEGDTITTSRTARIRKSTTPKMSHPNRTLPSHLRNASASMGGALPARESPVLAARIAEKKAELANLKELQALSAGLADQMQSLADKLTTLSDGTEGSLYPCVPSPAWLAGLRPPSSGTC